MTRRDSFADLERDLEELEAGAESADRWTDVQIVFVDSETGEHRTPDGELVDPDACDPIMKIGGEPPEDRPGGRR